MSESGDPFVHHILPDAERSARQREHFEEQRAWLLAQLKSVTLSRDSPPPQPLSLRAPRAPSSGVEERLLACGRERSARLAEARRLRSAERAAAEAHMRQRPPKPRAAPVAEGSGAGGGRSRRRRRAEEETTAARTFHPRISAESARLVEAQRWRNKTLDVPLVVRLSRSVAKPPNAEPISPSPRITAMAKSMSLPHTAAERLYRHARERQAAEDAEEDGEREEEINDEWTFHPRISRRAGRLQRRTGRRAHDDLYADGADRVHRRATLAAAQRDGAAFRPHIDSQSARLAARMGESAAERLLRPRGVRQMRARSQTPTRTVPAEALQRHFDDLYTQSQTRAARQQSLAEAAQALGPECTFAPRINHRQTHSETESLPVDERMRLWQERRERRLTEARERREMEEYEEEEGASVGIPKPRDGGSQQGIPTLSSSRNGRAEPNTHAAPPVQTHENATAMGKTVRHSDTVLQALRALENAERVSQYISC